MISQYYFIESRRLALPDEFPTVRNLSVSFAGLNDPLVHGRYHKRLCLRLLLIVLQISEYDLVREGFDRV